jgi:hypothetical protein
MSAARCSARDLTAEEVVKPDEAGCLSGRLPAGLVDPGFRRQPRGLGSASPENGPVPRCWQRGGVSARWELEELLSTGWLRDLP